MIHTEIPISIKRATISSGALVHAPTNLTHFDSVSIAGSKCVKYAYSPSRVVRLNVYIIIVVELLCEIHVHVYIILSNRPNRLILNKHTDISSTQKVDPLEK